MWGAPRDRGKSATLVVLLVLATALWLVGSASAAQYFSPGYRGKTAFRNDVPAPLPPVVVGHGKYPDLLVDGAGTGHVVFAQDGGTSAPDTLAYCNIQRGIRSCASSGTAPNPQEPEGGDFAGNFPAGNHDFDGPAPVVMGNELFVVDRRFPDQFPNPTGHPSDSNVFEWSSDNGGATLTGPGLIGDNQMAGGAVAFGDPNAPAIATISRTETGGTFFQAVPAGGTYTTAKAALGTGDQAYDGSLAVDESVPARLPVAAFADLSGNVFVREWTGTGDVNDASTWTKTSFPGFSPRIIGGAAGTFVMYSDSRINGGVMRLERIVSGQPSGSPVTLGRSASEPAISEDPTGRISFAYTDQLGVWTRSSTDGVNFTTAEYTAAIPRGGSIERLATAATADGGGFVSYIRNSEGGEGVGDVVVSAFGTQRATGKPGLGELPGGGLGSAVGDQMATSSCLQAKFGDVEAHITGACFGRDPSNPNLAVTLGEVNLNGLRIIPDQGTRIGIDPRAHTIDTTGKVRVVLTAGSINLTLWHEALHIKVPDDGAGSILADLKDYTGQAAPVIQGLPVSGDVDIKIAKGGVDIPISLTLPKFFGGVTGSATLHATVTGGLSLSSLEFKVGDLNIGALELKDVDVSYTQEGDVWKGSGELLVPAGGGAFSMKLSVEFGGGNFSGSFDLGLGYPGLPLDDTDPPPQIYLTHAGLGLRTDPLTFSGTTGLGIIPLAAPGEGDPHKDFVFRLEGQLSVAFGAPVTITASAQGFLYSLQLAQATLTYMFPSSVSLTGTAGFGQPDDLLYVSGSIGAIIDPRHKVFGARIKGDVRVKGFKLPVEPAFAINNKGFAVFLPVNTIPIVPFNFLSGTVSYNWGDSSPDLHTGDTTGDYTAGIPGAAADGPRAHTAGAMTVNIPAHAPSATIRIHGNPGAPQPLLFAPGGQAIPLNGTGAAKAGALSDPKSNTTFIGIDHPRAGRWTVAEAPGSAAITALEYTIAEPSPKVSARVSGRGSSRTLRYKIKAPANVSVSFAEQTGSMLHVIGAAHGRSGTIHFRPAFGPGGRRTLIAQITNNGRPLPNRTLATYSVPRPPRPGRAARLRVRAGGRTFTFGFRPPANAARTLLQIATTDGRHLQRIVSARTRSGSVPVIGFRDGLTVTVTGIAPDGARGPSVRASARRKK